jgi:protoheme IX farnesyltransferase
VLGAGSIGVIAATSNLLTLALGIAALAIYVLVYTPMKRITPWAVVVGAVPGALPPLMGWTAASGGIATPGLFLFGILFLWQLPHFIAISLYLENDFARAGIRTTSVVLGRRPAGAILIVSLLALVGFSLLAHRLGVAGWTYTGVAGVSGAFWVVQALRGDRSVDDAWARRMFGLSLLYLPILITALVLDAL